MLEVYVIVEKQKSIIMKGLTMLAFVMALYCLVASLLGAYFFMPVAILFFALGWFWKNRSIEFEYSYFDGEFRFAKVISKQKRKQLRGYEADNVMVLAPKGDRSLYNYEKNSQVKIIDLTSGNKDAKVYGIVAKVEEGLQLLWFEPDEKYIDAVCIKYRQKVVR